MTLTIRKKLLLTFGGMVLLIAVCQVIFNVFFSKSFFIYRKTGLMEKSFEDIRETYDEDMDEIDVLLEKLQDDNGIKVALLINDETLYTPDYTGLKKRQTISRQAFNEAEFPDTVDHVVKHLKDGQKDRMELQLSGKFVYNDSEIKVLMKLSMESIDNSISLFTETSIYISLIVLVIGIVFSVRFSRTLSAPINSVETVSKKIAMLDFSAEADESVKIKELASLAKNINIML